MRRSPGLGEVVIWRGKDLPGRGGFNPKHGQCLIAIVANSQLAIELGGSQDVAGWAGEAIDREVPALIAAHFCDLQERVDP